MKQEFRLTKEQQDYFEKGITLYNKGAFFESHEEWEVLWNLFSDSNRLYFQALIQLASGYLKLEEKVFGGAYKHFLKSQEKLKQFPDSFLKVNNREIKTKLADAIKEIESLGEKADSEALLDARPTIVVE